MDRQDISLLKNYYLELIRKGDLQGEISDVNLDGELDMQDYMIIKMSYLGI